ncbi:MAG: competence protein ComEA [Moorella sp. (in: firmicutes)]|uniref:ComEA family DNA-binding protein n=1 Tax=Moorella sp. E306M TaxID=2572683 RepID=UPI0010FFB1FD|nr:ComEA family DNA-binding protein [Moorella sp. E306M]MDK2815767.1 competence protein ComEA [Moorella sp. (in: firmicutes)]GEA17385.1 competence protein ComEA [Moorella sp. E306M]
MWEWDGRVRWLAAALVAALLFGAGLQYGRWQERQAAKELPRVVPGDKAAAALTGDKPAAEDQGANGSKPPTIQVHVAGAVQRPGVYELKAGARVNEAVSLAGLLPEANPNALNLAAPLNDGQQVIVPRQGEAGPAGGSSNFSGPVTSGGGTAGDTAKTGGKVNINTATMAELDSLPGIGPTLAQRIIDYRNQKGPFRTIEDLQNVSGIGPGRFNDLKDLITVY